MRTAPMLRRARWAHPSPKVRRKAVAQVHDRGLLSQMARSDPDAGVRLEAARMIDWPEEMSELALHHWDPQVRRLAVMRTEDPAVIVAAALKDPNERVRAAAVGRLHDQSLLAEMAGTSMGEAPPGRYGTYGEPSGPKGCGDSSAVVRAAAVRLMTNSRGVLRSYWYDSDERVRRTAEERLIELGFSRPCGECDGAGELLSETCELGCSPTVEPFTMGWAMGYAVEAEKRMECRRCGGTGRVLKL